MSLRVLVVDDERALLAMLEEALGVLGCTPVTASSLKQGLERALADDFDLMLLDNHFPEGHGDSIIPAVLVANPELPIVVITANEGDQHVANALRIGAREVLRKPFSLTDLVTVMERYCPTFRPLETCVG